MLLRVDHQSPQAIHEQLAGQLRQAIADGNPAAGEKLPAARELAKSLGINVHTLLRAFQTLRDEGLLEVRRGRGTIVTGAAPALAAHGELARKLVVEARKAGLGNNEIRQLINVHL